MKKKNKFEGFYEDEESLTMLESINKAADRERVLKLQREKEEAKKDKYFKIFVVASTIFILLGATYLTFF